MPSTVKLVTALVTLLRSNLTASPDTRKTNDRQSAKGLAGGARPYKIARTVPVVAALDGEAQILGERDHFQHVASRPSQRLHWCPADVLVAQHIQNGVTEGPAAVAANLQRHRACQRHQCHPKERMMSAQAQPTEPQQNRCGQTQFIGTGRECMDVVPPPISAPYTPTKSSGDGGSLLGCGCATR